MKQTTRIIRFVIALIFVTIAIDSVYSQDTVRLNDNRFIYPQLQSKDFYFYRWERELAGFVQVEHGSNRECAGYESVLDKESATIYGIAIPLCDFSMSNVIWLKIMDSIPGNEHNAVLDSVRITDDSEQKTLILEEIITREDGELTDSIARIAYTLYCGYFDRPIQVNDSSFFVYAHVTSGTVKIPRYHIYPPDITRYNYGVEHIFGEIHGEWYLDSNYAHSWYPILPIIAPPPGWTPNDPEDPDNPGGDEGIDNFEIQNSEFEINIYPNPASGYAVVTCDTPIRELSLCDLNGRMVLTLRNCGGSAKVDTSVLAPGVYMLKVTTDAGTATRKLVVKP